MDIIACSNTWFLRWSGALGFDLLGFYVVTERNELTQGVVEEQKPDYVFFPHWNWKVPKSIHESVESVVFHIAPLPEGRGGSPIQNLILRGFQEAPLNSLQMTDSVDAGPIYFSDNLDLTGTLEEIFARATPLIWRQISAIRDLRPTPRPQSGRPSQFRRLTATDNQIESNDGFETIWNKLRMVEAYGYPDATISLGDAIFSFSDVSRDGDEINGKFRVVPMRDDSTHD